MAEAIMERPIPTGEGLTYEKVWAMFQETGKKFQETDQLITRIFTEADERIKKLELLVKKNSELYGGLSNNFGALAENMVGPDIAKRFNELDYHFDLVATKGSEIKDKNGKIITQIDILLENGETIIAVEVKAKPAIKDIEHHKRRLEIVRDRWSNIRNKRMKVMGAIAGAIFEDDVKEAVQKAGFYAIVQSGDTMKIEMTDDFVPKEW
jgi:hypothetical protein